MSDYCGVCRASDDAGGRYFAGDYWFCNEHFTPEWINAWLSLEHLKVFGNAVERQEAPL